MTMTIQRVRTGDLSAPSLAALHSLWIDAYGEDLRGYLGDIGQGEHLLGWRGPVLVSHVMWVDRALQAGDAPTLRTAYVELVATLSSERGKGFASQLMRVLVGAIGSYELGALSPTNPAFYERLGWELWRGPLLVRTERGVVATPDESIMIRRLSLTPRGLRLDDPLSVEWRPGEVW